ncbi:hypothetical protein MBGDN05_00067 [Thermoplasmatales archaeon SCGC AB-539-N05]|nr:hypothetical protein MBGDN05_00067 [Thermoplasmatales archaeon SCGC AB-539-N05]
MKRIENYREMFSDILILIGFILLGTIGRTLLVGWNLQPFPNFEIIMVITFLAAIFLRPTMAILVPLISMIFSDLLLGNSIFVGNQMNRIVLFTYSGFAMIALVNIFNRNKFGKSLGELKIRNIGIAAGLGIGFVLIYDVWTNIGWWYLIYPHTTNSLAAVFTAGIPFMIYHMLSGAFTFIVIALPIVAYVSMGNKIEMPLKIRNVHKIPVAILVLCLVALSFTGTAMQIPEKSEIWLENSDETSIKIVIFGDGWLVKDNIFAYDGDTVFSILEEISERNDVSLEFTYYEQFDSILIDSIGNNQNGNDGKYWQYYVNGDIPMVGCDKYNVSNGDCIEWRFEAISY